MSFIQKFLGLDVDLDNIGIVYHDKNIVNFIGDMTPLNSLVFASTGTDSLHYCVVQKENTALDESPVYLVAPPNFEDVVIWVAKDFVDFLSLGVAFECFATIPCARSWGKETLLKNIKENQVYHIQHGYDEKIKKSINILRDNFPMREYTDPRAHIISTYDDINNHVDLKFGIPDIYKAKLGHYNRK